jgi:hypothetical protein
VKVVEPFPSSFLINSKYKLNINFPKQECFYRVFTFTFTSSSLRRGKTVCLDRASTLLTLPGKFQEGPPLGYVPIAAGRGLKHGRITLVTGERWADGDGPTNRTRPLAEE